MRFLTSLLLLAASLQAESSWPRVLAASGLDSNSILCLEGASGPARDLGFRPSPSGESVEVRSVIDSIQPSLQIVWAVPVQVPRFEVPPQAVVFSRERWTGVPLAAGFRRGAQIVFWTATPLGERGYERYPYIPQALLELGALPKSESRALWAFFDSSYRLRADPDYLASRWRSGGIAALHIAAWHYWEPDPQRDAWLAALIEACHRHAISAYAWVELPHVSQEFWLRHPEWREQTAAGQDAHLDWRRLMNLANPDCSAAVHAGLSALLRRFDWDGINLGELYFESLEGYLNPARFTPFNADVRRSFQAQSGVDPRDLYNPQSPAYHLRDARPMQRFLAFRADLAADLQRQWLGRIQQFRQEKPWLDMALTHVDDRFDTSMRDALGADAARLLPAAAQQGATFLIEDPATIWHLGPERYEEIARRYAGIAPPQSRLAIDLNVVSRYQDVYPTRQQTGSELLQLVRSAARSFPRVALYFENSILAPDWPLLAAAASPADVQPLQPGEWKVTARATAAANYPGCALVNGRSWPVASAGKMLLPRGEWILSACPEPQAPLLADFNGELLSAEVVQGRLRVEYESQARAIAIPARRPEKPILLPPGRHSVWID
ncbi:MAG: hypothetical protein HY821_19275 [Acidobacteria bacterium]|nr:hypothetical protein [Acidobacteriota bacterium]